MKDKADLNDDLDWALPDDDPDRYLAVAPPTRQRIVNWANWGHRHEPSIHYSQRRPVDGLNTPGKAPLYVDCSGFVTLCYRWGGASDPNGGRYRGTMYTGSLLQHCMPIRESALRAGDLVVFGPGTGDHVLIMVTDGPGGAVVSHGAEAGPKRYSLAAAKTYFRGPVRPLRAPDVRLLEVDADLADGDLDPDAEPVVADADINVSNSPTGEPDTEH